MCVSWKNLRYLVQIRDYRSRIIAKKKDEHGFLSFRYTLRYTSPLFVYISLPSYIALQILQRTPNGLHRKETGLLKKDDKYMFVFYNLFDFKFVDIITIASLSHRFGKISKRLVQQDNIFTKIFSDKCANAFAMYAPKWTFSRVNTLIEESQVNPLIGNGRVSQFSRAQIQITLSNGTILARDISKRDEIGSRWNVTWRAAGWIPERIFTPRCSAD